MELQRYITFIEEAEKLKSIVLPDSQAKRMMELWEEYNSNETPEAKLIKALDKAETILQHNRGDNPEEFYYRFNLEYGKEYFKDDEMLVQLRAILDEMTIQRMSESSNSSSNSQS
jgi:putative hydrolases of HD superfamily